jgi:hypothetical protein
MKCIQMESPKPFPPGFTSYEDKFYEWAFDYLERHGKDIDDKMSKSRIAESVREAQDDFEEAEYRLESKQYDLEQAKKYNATDRVVKLESEIAAAGVMVLLMKIRLLNTQIAKSKEKPERSTDFRKTVEAPSSFIKGTIKSGGKKNATRRRRITYKSK